jgi:aminopeptidase N
MLARLLGEETLLGALQHFARQHEFGTVTTDDLISSVEAFTGEELRWFFDQWVYRAGYPALVVSKQWDEDNNVVRMKITQAQAIDSLTGLFRFPMDVELTTSSGTDVREIWVSEQEETFTFPVDGEPLMVIIDKGLDVLKSVDHPRTKSEFLFQLANASEGIERLEACEGLAVMKDDEDVFDALRTAGRRDSFWAVRTKAINTLVDMEGGDMEMFAEFYDDEDPRVRAAAITALAKFPSDETASIIEQAARLDSSYVVLSACIRTLAGVDSSRGFDLASRCADMNSYRDMIRVASLNALRRISDDRSVPIAMRFTGPSYETPTRVVALGILADQRTPDAERVMAGLARTANTRVRIEAIKALGKWDGGESARVLEEIRSTEENPDVLRVLEEVLLEKTN